MTVIASDGEAIEAKPQLPSPRLDRFALLAMTKSAVDVTERVGRLAGAAR